MSENYDPRQKAFQLRAQLENAAQESRADAFLERRRSKRESAKKAAGQLSNDQADLGLNVSPREPYVASTKLPPEPVGLVLCWTLSASMHGMPGLLHACMLHANKFTMLGFDAMKMASNHVN